MPMPSVRLGKHDSDSRSPLIGFVGVQIKEKLAKLDFLFYSSGFLTKSGSPSCTADAQTTVEHVFTCQDTLVYDVMHLLHSLIVYFVRQLSTSLEVVICANRDAVY